jgi:hypothetical protein
MSSYPPLCRDHGGPEEIDDWCDVCVAEMEAADAREAAQAKVREAREAKIEAAWLATGGICSARPFGFRRSGRTSCTEKLEFLTQLCDCQVCEDCGQPHNTGREEFAEDECQCLAGDGP